MKYIDFDSKEQQNRFLADPIIIDFNQEIAKIFSLSIPEKMYIDNTGRVVKEYSEKVTAKLNAFVKERNQYILLQYGKSPGDDTQLH